MKLLVSKSVVIPRGLYHKACPNCGGVIDDYRLVLGLPCKKCLPSDEIISKIHEEFSWTTIADILRKTGTIGKVKDIEELERDVRDLENLFEKCIGRSFWSIQRLWAKRLLAGQSFAMIAPTGVGKTTFGLIAALWLALKKGKKSYIIVPTTALVKQYEEKLEEYQNKIGSIVSVAAIHSRLSPKRRKELEDSIARGAIDIVVTTSAFLRRKFELLKNTDFHLIFVDDVDAVMKGSKVIELLLQLMGFEVSDIEGAYEIIKLKRKLIRASAEEVKKLLTEIKEQERKLIEKRKGKVLIISSATGRPRGSRVKLFRELLGFDIGARPELFRNVVDTYIKIPESKGLEDVVIETVSKLGNGGLVYVPIDKGIDYARKLAEKINQYSNIKADYFVTGRLQVLDKFISGEVNVLVGVATFYGVMVRGLDLPERVRYAVFVGVPRHKVRLDLEEPSPLVLLRVLIVLAEVGDEQIKDEISRYIVFLRRLIMRRSPAYIEGLVKNVISGKIQTYEEKELHKIHIRTRELINKPEVVKRLKEYGRVSLIEENGYLYLLIPDVATYIQASGRTSRLYAGGITKGLSVIICDDERLLAGLEYRMKWIIEGFQLQKFEDVDLNKVLKEIDEDRVKVKAVREGRIEILRKEMGEDLIRTALLIVESPNKARTIASFFGRPSAREILGVKVYEVDIGNLHLLIAASGGHVYDLVVDDDSHSVFGVRKITENKRLRFIPIYTSIKRCLSCGHQFTQEVSKCPLCNSPNIKDSWDIIEALRKIAMEVDEVLIGTDPDREGEKIGYDIAALLAPYARSIKRIEFHEVTRRAILNALSSPKDIDMKRVEAQIVRRVEDRWIGFSLSEVVTKELIDFICEGRDDIECRQRRLSAGRVQTPVLGWIIERTADYRSKLKTHYIMYIDGTRIELSEDQVTDTVRKDDELLIRVNTVGEEVIELNPLPPFTTDTLLSEAHRFYGMSAPSTMRIAQELFEMGFITYHRTDSTRISDVGLALAREYIYEKFKEKAKDLHIPRRWGEVGAHEAIRPTRPADTETLSRLIAEGIIEPVRRLSRQHYLLYDLIFRRFIASQMRSSKVKKTTYLLKIYKKVNGDLKLIAETQISGYTDIVDPGFTLIYMPFKILRIRPKEYIVKGEEIQKRKISPIPLLTQGEVVKLMKERGIGRPSTYAKIVEVLLRRGYVKSSKKLGALIPTRKGIYVYTYLALSETRDLYKRIRNVFEKYIVALEEKLRREKKKIGMYEKLVSEERTRELEERLDMVEEGKKDYEEVLLELYEELKNYNLLR